MSRLILQAVSLICALAALSAVVLITAMSFSGDPNFPGCAVTTELKDPLKLAIEQYSESIQQLLTLSTALVALEAAVLLGFQKGLELSFSRRILIFVSTIAFVCAAYSALVWKSRLGNILYQGCPSLLTDSMMTNPFQATGYNFLVGLVLIGVVVFSAAFEGRRA